MEFTYELSVRARIAQKHPHENFIFYKNAKKIHYFIDNNEN